jgi:hypothetical protein
MLIVTNAVIIFAQNGNYRSLSQIIKVSFPDEPLPLAHWEMFNHSHRNYRS